MARLKLWLIGTIGGDQVAYAPSIAHDMVALTQRFRSVNAEIQWIAGLEVRQAAWNLDPALQPLINAAWEDSRASIKRAFEDATAYVGERRFWIGGPAAVDELEGPALQTGERNASPTTLRALWEGLHRAARDAEGPYSLIGLLDLCHAQGADTPALTSPRFAGIAASGAKQRAVQTPTGGAFTQAICHALEQGARTLGEILLACDVSLGGGQLVRQVGRFDTLRNHDLIPGLSTPLRHPAHSPPNPPAASLPPTLPASDRVPPQPGPLRISPAPHKLLPTDTLHDLVDACIDQNLNRDTLLLGLPSGFLASLSIRGNPRDQFLSDLDHLNRTDELIGHTEPPLRTWLRTAVRCCVSPKPRGVFEGALSTLGATP